MGGLWKRFRKDPLPEPLPPNCPPPSRPAARRDPPPSPPQAVVAVISSPRPPLRVQTNPRYAPLLALHSADRQGALSIRAMHGLLRRRAAPLRAVMAALRCVTCGCCRQSVAPV